MRNYAENGELCGIVRRTENCAISHSPHLNVASGPNLYPVTHGRISQKTIGDIYGTVTLSLCRSRRQ